MLLTNARSLLPKTGALVDAFDSLNLDVACVTETWFKPGRDLLARLDDLEGEYGIKVVHRSRDGRSRRAAEGVVVAFRTGACNLRKRDLKSRKEGQEIICVTGKIGKVPRKVAIFVVYVPPDMRAQGFRELCDTLVLEIAAVKVALGDPVMYVAGDFNHRDVGPSLKLAADLRLIVTAPTRGLNNLDLIYTNAIEKCEEVLVLPPLDTSTGIRSEHRCVHVRSEFPPVKNFTWVAKLRRSRTRAAEDAFAAAGTGRGCPGRDQSTTWHMSWRERSPSSRSGTSL